jgi:hypothetical protein
MFFAVAGVALLGELEAQQKQRVWRIGYLSAGPAPADRSLPLFARTKNRNARSSDGRGTGHHVPRANQLLTTEGLDRTLRVPSFQSWEKGNEQS